MLKKTGDTSGADGTLTATEVRALLNVAIDLADDLDVDCAVVVVDAAGALRGAERPGAVPGEQLDRALEGARAVLREHRAELAGPRVGAVPLGLGRGALGALGVSGGPEGFAIEACRAAARALGLGGAAAAA